MRRSSMVWMGAAAAVVVAVVAAAVWHGRVEPEVRSTAIDAVYADEQTLDVHLTFPSCYEVDRIDVAEDGRAVRLTAYVHRRTPPSCGTSPIDRRTVPVRLRQPLRDRSVVDSVTGGNILVR